MTMQNEATPFPERTAAQRAGDYLLGRTVYALDLLGQGVGAVVSCFTRKEWDVHFYVRWNCPPFVDAWREAGGDGGTTYVLHLGRVEYNVYRTPKAPKGTQQASHASGAHTAE